MAKKGWGKPGAAGLAEGDYILQFSELGNRDRQGKPNLYEPEGRGRDETPTSRVVFRDLVISGPMKEGEVVSSSVPWNGIDVVDDEIVFRAKGQRVSGLIRGLKARGMQFPTDEDPGDTVYAEPPDPNKISSILIALETILQKRRKDGCLAQAHVDEDGWFVWDSWISLKDDVAKMYLAEKPIAQKPSFEALRQEIFARTKTLQEAGIWSSDEAREYIKQEYGVESSKEMNLGQLQDLKTYIGELAEEKGISLGEPF